MKPSRTPDSRAPRVLLGAAVTLHLLMVVLSISFARLKQSALDFHERDFPYYAQFDVRALDSRYAPEYSLSPNGHDLFGFVGTEGTRGLHQAIHFEPVKYLTAALYRLTGALMVAFAFVAIVYFAPIVYLALRLPRRDRLDLAFTALACLCYALYPSSLDAVTFDLRPFSLLMPTFALAVLSVVLARPRNETLFFFNALFLVREEALVFGLVVMLVALALDLRLATSPRGAAGPRPPLGAMLGCYVAWTAVEIAYFAWCGYGNVQPLAVPLGIAGFALVSAGLVVLAARFLRRRPDAMTTLALLPTGTLVLGFAPLVFQQVFDRDLVNHPDLFLYAPMYALHAGLLLALWAATWTVLRDHRKRAAYVGVTGALAVLLLVALAGPWKRAMPCRLVYCSERAANAALVFGVREQTRPLETAILTDQATFQAFYDYENVIVYERLPWHLVAGEGRRWPRNRAMLEDLVRERIEWIVIDHASHDAVMSVLEGAEMADRVTLVDSNGRYEIHRITRP